MYLLKHLCGFVLVETVRGQQPDPLELAVCLATLKVTPGRGTFSWTSEEEEGAVP